MVQCHIPTNEFDKTNKLSVDVVVCMEGVGSAIRRVMDLMEVVECSAAPVSLHLEKGLLVFRSV